MQERTGRKILRSMSSRKKRWEAFLGAYVVEFFTPVINLPKVAILEVNIIIYRPDDIWNGVLGFIPVTGLSLTYDHSAPDGLSQKSRRNHGLPDSCPSGISTNSPSSDASSNSS
jgi:hypothetical protein